jgi:sortase A
MTITTTSEPATGADVPADPGHSDRPRGPIPPRLLVTGVAAALLSVLAGFFVVYAFGLSALQERRDQHQLYASFRGVIAPASPIAPAIGGVIAPGTPVAVLDAPEAGLHNTVVVEGTSSSDLMAGPGHLRDTPLPGQIGQSILMGRSVLAGAPFHGITKLRAGDPIVVTTGQGQFTYTVNDVRSAGDVQPVIPAGGSVLTLVTSHGSGWLSALAPGHVVLVDATLKGQPAAAPTSPTGALLQRPVAVPIDELPARGDPSAWVFIVLWSQALLGVAVGAVWSWKRWGQWQTWLVAGSLLLGVLWGLSQETIRLLPNVL